MNLKLHSVVNVKPVYFTATTIMLLIFIFSMIIAWSFFTNKILLPILVSPIAGAVVVFTRLIQDQTYTYDFGEDFTITDTNIILGDRSYDRMQMNTLTVKIEGYKGMYMSNATVIGINNYVEVGFRDGGSLNARLYLENKEEAKELSDFYRSYYQ